MITGNATANAIIEHITNINPNISFIEPLYTKYQEKRTLIHNAKM